jgi:hypothetical protein
MGVDVDQTRRDDLAARIDRVRGFGRNIGVHRGDFARGDRHVADRIEPDRRIDDTPASDDEIIGRRSRADAVKRRSTGGAGGCAYELAPIHDGPPDMVWINTRSQCGVSHPSRAGAEA